MITIIHETEQYKLEKEDNPSYYYIITDKINDGQAIIDYTPEVFRLERILGIGNSGIISDTGKLCFNSFCQEFSGEME